MHKSAFTLVDYDSANPLHKERFGALNREWLVRYFRVEDHDEAAFADPEGHVLESGGVLLFAQVGNEIIGTGSLVPMEKAVFEIAKMAVTDAWQGRGIGEQMLVALIARAVQKNAQRLFIVSNTALEPAIRLYRKHGFADSAESRHGHYERGNITLERAMEKQAVDKQASSG